ncbi:MAG: carotenoid biosynthesis protein [Rubrivivax sp.]|nr:carotenoid biosynthesis protein [Pyrinomonadaceae bacterium]
MNGARGASVADKRRGAARWRRGALAVLAPAFAVLWIGGVASQWSHASRASDGPLASLFLFLAGFLVLLGARARRGAAALVSIALLGFIVEVIGANYDFPFGAYAYTDALRPQLFGVPLVMGFAWMALAAQGWEMATRLRLSPPLTVILAALWTTAVDLVIDPLAANHLAYWKWERAGAYYGIPASNFAGWLVTALLAFILFGSRLESNFWARAVGFAIVLFFAFGALANSLLTAALVGFALCAVQLFIGYSGQKRERE